MVKVEKKVLVRGRHFGLQFTVFGSRLTTLAARRWLLQKYVCD